MKGYSRYILLAGVSCSAAACSQKVEQQKSPNIIIIYADDMGYGDMSCQNPGSKIPTPNLDKLASEGVRFTDGHSSCSISSPSRYALLTGNYHWRRGNIPIEAFHGSAFKDGELTIPEMLKERGYYTAMVGKWHLGWDWESIINDEAKEKRAATKGIYRYSYQDIDWSRSINDGPCDHGYDYYFGDGVINLPPYCWIEREMVIEAPTVDLIPSEYSALEGEAELRPGPAVEGWDFNKVLPTLADKMVSVINNADDNKPLFLMCALSAPHAPIIPSEEFHGKSEAGYYGDFVVQCDDIVGRILSAIKERGEEDNTIVIFSADNGSEHYALNRIENFGHNSTAPLRGVKRDVWEGGHRVPFIVRWPDKVKPAVSNEVVSQVDIISTLADIVGYKLADSGAVDSYSLLPLLLGESYTKPLREATIHNTVTSRSFAIRQGDWLLIDSNSGTHMQNESWARYEQRYDLVEYKKDEREFLLFNLKNDIMQREDLSQSDNSQRADQMTELLAKYKREGRSVPKRL